MLVLPLGGEIYLQCEIICHFVVFSCHVHLQYIGVIGTLLTLLCLYNVYHPIIIDYCSGLAVKKMIDCGAGVVDADCK